jgi:hypothetical protein
MEGFGSHAAVRCAGDHRKALESLCRTITSPALAAERVQCNATEQALLKLKLKTPGTLVRCAWCRHRRSSSDVRLRWCLGRTRPLEIWLHAAEWQLCGIESLCL